MQKGILVKKNEDKTSIYFVEFNPFDLLYIAKNMTMDYSKDVKTKEFSMSAAACEYYRPSKLELDPNSVLTFSQTDSMSCESLESVIATLDEPLHITSAMTGEKSEIPMVSVKKASYQLPQMARTLFSIVNDISKVAELDDLIEEQESLETEKDDPKYAEYLNEIKSAIKRKKIISIPRISKKIYTKKHTS